MPIVGATRYRAASGTVWRITGTPGKSWLRIRLLGTGKYADCVRRHPALIDHAMQLLQSTLIRFAPVDTGQLRSSIARGGTGRQQYVQLGPRPYDRTALKAALAGRTPRRRRRGRPRKVGFYAGYANVRSFSPRYLERSIDTAAREFIRLCKQFEDADRRQTPPPQARRTTRRSGPSVRLQRFRGVLTQQTYDTAVARARRGA